MRPAEPKPIEIVAARMQREILDLHSPAALAEAFWDMYSTGIAYAIETRGSYHAKRCCVEVTGDHAVLCSPRNSTYEARVPLARADELSAAIRALIPEEAPDDD